MSTEHRCACRPCPPYCGRCSCESPSLWKLPFLVVMILAVVLACGWMKCRKRFAASPALKS
jgi:hypothetical protein